MNPYKHPYIAIDVDNQNERKLFLCQEKALVDNPEKLKLGDRGTMSVTALHLLYTQGYIDNLPTDEKGNYVLILNPFTANQLKIDIGNHYTGSLSYSPCSPDNLERMQGFFTDIPRGTLESYYFGNYLHFDIFLSRQLAFKNSSYEPIQTRITVEDKEVTTLHNLLLSHNAFLQTIQYAQWLKEHNRSSDDFVHIGNGEQSNIEYIKILAAKEAF